MPKAFCLLNHALTQNQIAELKERFAVTEIVYPSEELSKKWAQIPPVKELDFSIIKMAASYLNSAYTGDILIIQGETGASFMLVDYALKKHLVPIYAVTARVSKEVVAGEQVVKQNVFEHVCFRQYAYYPEF